MDERKIQRSLSDCSAIARAKAKGVTRDELRRDRVTKNAVSFVETPDGKVETRIVDNDPGKPVLRRLMQMTEDQRVAEREIGQEISIRDIPAEVVRSETGIGPMPVSAINRRLKRGAFVRAVINWGRPSFRKTDREYRAEMGL